MGIKALLPLLKHIAERIHISKLKGKAVAIDAYIWLYKGASMCAKSIYFDQPTDIFINYCLKRLEYLLENGLKPLVVFDGAQLPLKEITERQREETRRLAVEKAEAAIAAGEDSMAEAYFLKAVKVTHEMARRLIKELAKRNVPFIVSPYEADAQLAFLSQQNIVETVITDDSDALPYCCKDIIFKLENDGHGQELLLSNLKYNPKPSFQSWTNGMFLSMCVLAGCDYAPRIKKLGITTAYSLVDKYREPLLILEALNKRSNFIVPPEYELDFKKARFTFRHQLVYDPNAKQTVPLMPINQKSTDFDTIDFIGKNLPASVAQGIAESRLHPVTYKEYDSPLLSIPVQLTCKTDKMQRKILRRSVSFENDPCQCSLLSSCEQNLNEDASNLTQNQTHLNDTNNRQIDIYKSIQKHRNNHMEISRTMNAEEELTARTEQREWKRSKSFEQQLKANLPLAAKYFTCTSVSDTLATLQHQRLVNAFPSEDIAQRGDIRQFLQLLRKEQKAHFENVEIGKFSKIVGASGGIGESALIANHSRKRKHSFSCLGNTSAGKWLDHSVERLDRDERICETNEPAGGLQRFRNFSCVESPVLSKKEEPNDVFHYKEPAALMSESSIAVSKDLNELETEECDVKRSRCEKRWDSKLAS